MVASRVSAGKKQDVEEKWEEIGFHKPLGQFWWNYLLTIIMALASLIFTSVLIPNFILPFPETFGYYSVATAFFTLLFTILNNGTSDVVTRYISEHAVDNPRKTLEYIRFFIWFQMITGLVQVTGIAMFSLYLMPNNLSYMKWVFIIYSTIQFPGMLTVYQGCLNGFQRFDKSNMLQIFQTALIQPLVLIGCVLVFKNLGAMYPGYGEMMGSLIGYVIGNYLDDFITFSISAKMFAPVLKKIGYSLRDTLIPKVSMDVVKNALFFGTKMMVTGMLYQLVHFFVNIMIINWVPQYGTILGIYGIAKSICDITLMQLPMTPILSEAYNHEKYALYNYGISFQLKYFGMLPGFLAIEIGMMLPLLLYVIIGGNYSTAAYIIPVLLPVRFTALGCRFIDRLQIGADKPNLFIATRVVEQVTRFIAHFVLLNPKLVPSLLPPSVKLNFLGGNAIAIPIFFIVYSFCDFPGMIAKNLFGLVTLNRRILKPVNQKLHIPWWQMLGAMSIVFAAMIAINGGLLWLFNIIRGFGDLAAYIGAAGYLVLMLFGAPLVIFLLYSFFGGWDDYGLKIFEDATRISGPSKKYVSVIFKISRWAHERSPLKNRFPIHHEAAERERLELNMVKRETWEALQVEKREREHMETP